MIKWFMGYLDLSNDYKIEYVAKNGNRTKRVISPIRNFQYNGESYMEAFCHKRGSNRTFKIANIIIKSKLGSKSIFRNPSYPEANWPYGIDEAYEQDYQTKYEPSTNTNSTNQEYGQTSVLKNSGYRGINSSAQKTNDSSFSETNNKTNYSSNNEESFTTTFFRMAFVVGGIMLFKSCSG
jgi:hypothetical protein